MVADRLTLYCVNKGISLQMVYAFKETIYSSLKTRFSVLNNPTQRKEYKRLPWRYIVLNSFMVLPFVNWFSLLQYYSSITECVGTWKFRQDSSLLLTLHMHVDIMEEDLQWLVLPHLECPQWPLSLVVPPPHAHDPPDMQPSLLSSHPGVGQ